MRSLPVACAAIVVGLVAGSRAATLDGLAVDVTNGSERVLCAEKDNVTLNFASPQVKQFRIEATHPVYIGGLRDDRFAPDWSACEDISAATSEVPPPRKVTFYEDVEVWLTGFSFANFWRDKDVPIRVGDRVEHGLHLIQLWVRRHERAEEVLVLYPADGYWRIRPLPPAHLGWSAYGSSFLVGPIEQAGRPLVNIKEIAFDRRTMTFTLDLRPRRHGEPEDRGPRPRAARPRRRLRPVDRGRPLRDPALDVRDRDQRRRRPGRPARGRAPRAGARSRSWSSAAASATDVWTGRTVPSSHNTSAPDIVFSRFRPAAAN